MAMEELGRRERKKLQTRQAISDVATTLFMERGFDHVTVAEVAKAADVAVQTVFNHFPTKEDLLFDEQGWWLGPAQVIRELPAGVGMSELVEALEEHYLSVIRSRLRSGHLVTWKAFDRTIDESPALQARRRKNAEEMEALIVAALQEREPQPDAEPGPQPSLELSPQPGPQPSPQLSPQSRPQPSPELSPHSGQQPSPERGPQSGPQSSPQLGPQSGPQSSPERGPQSGPQSSPQLGPQSGPQSSPQLGPQSGPQSSPQPGPQSSSQPGPQPSLRPGLQPATRPAPPLSPLLARVVAAQYAAAQKVLEEELGRVLPENPNGVQIAYAEEALERAVGVVFGALKHGLQN